MFFKSRFKNLKQTISKLEQALSNMNLLNLDTNSWINFVGNIVTFLMPFLFGIYLVVKGQTSLGALFAIVQLANSFINPILFILDDRSKLSTTKKIVEKVNDFLDKEKDAENRKVVSLLSLDHLEQESRLYCSSYYMENMEKQRRLD